MILGIILLTVLCPGPAVLAAMPRGIIAGDVAGNVVILRDGQQIPAQRGEALYEGDILQGDGVDSLAIEWHPYTQAQAVGSNELKVVYSPPGALNLAIYKMKEFFGFVDGEMRAQYAATRGPVVSAPAGEERYPLPGYMATLLPGQPVTFAWGEARGKALVVETKDKRTVFRKEVSGQKNLELTPEEMGLTPGQTYLWRVEGLYDTYKLMLLDNDTASQVTEGLRSIETGAGTANDKLLNKAMFLQFASESSPDKVDLYWLSYRFLKAAGDDGRQEMKEKAGHLLRRFEQHLDSTR